MRNPGILLSLCVVTQLCLVGDITPHRIKVKNWVRHPKIEGISLLVDRIADSPYGLFNPLTPAGATPEPAASPAAPATPTPAEPYMDPQWTVPKPPSMDNVVPPEEIHRMIELEAQRNHIDPLLIEAIIRNESGFNPWAVSPTGALGLMQLMPDTAAQVGVTDPFDPAQNIAGGSAYLALQLRNFGGDVSLAVAAYNAGPAAVQRWGGIPPYQETMNYVSNVVSDYRTLMQQHPVIQAGNFEGQVGAPPAAGGSPQQSSVGTMQN